MAHKYLRSGAGGAGTGADWANAYTNLTAALAGVSAGDDLWVSEDHAESTASSVTFASPGTIASPLKIHCVNHAGSVPPVAADLATTATVSTTGNNNITFSTGYAYVYGVTFNCGSGANSPGLTVAGSAGGWTFKSCNLAILATGSGSTTFGAAGAVNYDIKLIDTKLKFGGTSQNISLLVCTFRWEGAGSSVDATGSAPTTLFATAATRTVAEIRDVDLSFLGSGKTLVAAQASSGQLRFVNCKLGASVTKAVSPTVPGPRVSFIRCDSGSTNYTDDEYDHYGTLSVETTIVRTGGASDGTTPIAHKIVTAADAKWINPFRSKPIIFWNDTTSAITVTLQGIWGGGAVPNNDDIWMEIDYLNDSGTPMGAIATTGKASNLATGSALTAGSGTWGGSTTKFAMSASITPAKKGPIVIYVKAAAASSTFYIDPKPVVT